LRTARLKSRIRELFHSLTAQQKIR